MNRPGTYASASGSMTLGQRSSFAERPIAEAIAEPGGFSDPERRRGDALARDRAVVRLLRDMALCTGGTVLGARLDGPMAYLAMQSICSHAGFDPLDAIALHLTVLPATSVLMALVAATCQWPARMQTPSAEDRRADRSISLFTLRWGAFAFRTIALFTAMMLVMSAMQDPIEKLLAPSPSSAVLASVMGMLLLAVASAALRPLALRVPFLVPFCCR